MKKLCRLGQLSLCQVSILIYLEVKNEVPEVKKMLTRRELRFNPNLSGSKK